MTLINIKYKGKELMFEGLERGIWGRWSEKEL
jgi:hypothetical protein